jgi:predicted ATPase
MKSFIFKEMLLASFLEKKARRIRFDPKMTIIRGGNETGKSSLIKSIFRTFGAEPAKVHSKWIDADVRSVIRFEVDGTLFALLQ